MTALVELVIGLVAIALIVVVFAVAFLMSDERRARRALRGKPVPVAGLAVGKAAKVTGAARSRGEPARTFRGEPCVWVRIELLHFFRRTGSDGAVSERWRPVAVEEHGGAFELADETGTAVVDPAGAIWVVEPSWFDLDWRDLSPLEEALVARHEGKVERGLPTKLRQTVVGDGQTVSVHGRVAAREGDRPVLRSTGRAKLAIGPG